MNGTLWTKIQQATAWHYSLLKSKLCWSRWSPGFLKCIATSAFAFNGMIVRAAVNSLTWTWTRTPCTRRQCKVGIKTTKDLRCQPAQKSRALRQAVVHLVLGNRRTQFFLQSTSTREMVRRIRISGTETSSLSQERTTTSLEIWEWLTPMNGTLWTKMQRATASPYSLLRRKLCWSPGHLKCIATSAFAFSGMIVGAAVNSPTWTWTRTPCTRRQWKVGIKTTKDLRCQPAQRSRALKQVAVHHVLGNRRTQFFLQSTSNREMARRIRMSGNETSSRSQEPTTTSLELSTRRLVQNSAS